MAGKIVMCTVSFGFAILFFSIGIYAKKLKTPMWFWSGTEVDASSITNVAQYNKANGVMWQLYSLWYFAAGAAELISTILSLILLILSGTAGIAILIVSYDRICKKAGCARLHVLAYRSFPRHGARQNGEVHSEQFPMV